MKETEGDTIAAANNAELKDEKNTIDIGSGLSLEDDDDEGDEDEDHYVNNFRLKSSKTMIYQPFHSSKDESQPEMRVRSKSSAQLLDLAQSTIKEEHDKLTSFVASLKAGDVTPKVASNFRIRRLTYENHGLDDCEGSSSSSPSKSSPIKKSPVKQASIKTPMTSTRRVIRTTIFASSEIGHVTETTPPFPESMLGK